MTKQEFENRIGATVSESDYRIIETVYTFHPAIDNVMGKDQIATIYKTCGMRVVRDMLPTAERAQEIENKMTELRTQLCECERGGGRIKCSVLVGAKANARKSQKRLRERIRHTARVGAAFLR